MHWLEAVYKLKKKLIDEIEKLSFILELNTDLFNDSDCFTYAVTSNPEGWNEAQQSCKNQFGGQLVSKNLGASGSAYHQ